MALNLKTLSLCSFIISFTLTLGACSPGSLTGGSNTDQTLLDRPSYNPPNEACTGLDLSTGKFTVPQFRQFTACLNGNGAIPKTAALVKALPDDELGPTVDLLNEQIFIPDFLKSTRVWFDQMESDQDLDPLLNTLATLLKDPDWAAALVQMSSDSRPEFLRALKKLSEKTEADSFRRGIRALESVAHSPAFASLSQRIQGEWNTRLDLKTASELLFGFLKDSTDSAHYVDTGKILLEEIASGRLFQVQDALLGTNPEMMKIELPRLSSTVKILAQKNLLNDVTSLFHHLNRPIVCMKQSKGVDNAIQFIIREIDRIAPSNASTYFIRDILLLQSFLNPFCEYPEQLGQYYPSMITLAQWSPIHPTVEMIQVLHRNGLSSKFVDILANTGAARPGVPVDTTGIKRLIPILEALEQQNLLDDLLLVSTLIRPEDRIHFQEIASFLLEGGKESIYTVLTETLTQQSARTLFILLSGLRTLVNEPSPVLIPAIEQIKTAHYKNNEDMLRKLIQGILKDAPSNPNFFRALKQSSRRPEFTEMLAEVGQLSRDRRIKSIIRSMLGLFQTYSERSSLTIQRTSKPARAQLIAHGFSADRLKPFPIRLEPIGTSPGCLALDLKTPIDDYRGPLFDQQIKNFMSCFNSDGTHDKLVDAVEFFRTRKTEENPPRSLLQLQIDLIKATPLTRVEIQDLTNRMLEWIRSPDQKIYRLLKGLPWWVSNKIKGSPTDPGGSVVRPLLEWVRPIYLQALDPLRFIQKTGSELLVRDEVPFLIEYGRNAWDLNRIPEPKPASFQLNRKTIQTWVTNKECHPNTGEPPNEERKQRRAAEIESDYFQTVNAWDLRRKYSKEDYFNLLRPMAKRLSDPKMSDPKRPFIPGLLRIMKYFSLEPGQKSTPTQHFTIQDLIDFFKVRATDARMITYIYPGEKVPRVRVVSSLDRLELVVVDANFEAPWPIGSKTNFAIQFLTQIGYAWGDEPRSSWPEDIQAMYPPGKTPPTLREAVNEILKTQRQFENLMGFPLLPPCAKTPDFNGPDWPRGNARLPGTVPDFLTGGMTVHELQRRLFNLNQVLSVVVESLPNQPGPLSGGLRILRNLFFELARTDPESIRARTPGMIDEKAGIRSDSYNMTFIAEGVRLGMTRQIGLLLRGVDRKDPEVYEFFKAFVEAAKSPQTEELLNSIFLREPNAADFKQTLAWSLLSGLYDWIDEAKPEEIAQLKQTSFYIFPLLNQLRLTDPSIVNLVQIVDQFRPLLVKKADLLPDLLGQSAVARLVRGLFEDQPETDENCRSALDMDCKPALRTSVLPILNDTQNAIELMKILQILDAESDRNPEMKLNWDRFLDRLEKLDQIPEYQKLDWSALTRQMVIFFEESPKRGQPNTATRMREYIARILLSGDIDQIMIAAVKEPSEFQKFLDALSQYSDNGQLLEFLQLIERNITDPKN